jgi:hypothetical protein
MTSAFTPRTEQLVAKLKQVKPGTYVTLTWVSEKQPAAAHKGTRLAKQTTAVCRVGIDYANLKSVKDAIAAGERGDVEPLPWGTWQDFPYTIEHKGNMYVRLYPKREGDRTQTSSVYFVNDVEVDKETFESYMTPSNRAKEERDLACFTVKAMNLTHVA